MQIRGIQSLQRNLSLLSESFNIPEKRYTYYCKAKLYYSGEGEGQGIGASEGKLSYQLPELPSYLGVYPPPDPKQYNRNLFFKHLYWMPSDTYMSKYLDVVPRVCSQALGAYNQ